jgi:hypothetical protein
MQCPACRCLFPPRAFYNDSMMATCQQCGLFVRAPWPQWRLWRIWIAGAITVGVAAGVLVAQQRLDVLLPLPIAWEDQREV